MTYVVSSFRINPARHCSSTQASHPDESNTRKVSQGFPPAAFLASKQHARASEARINGSPGAHCSAVPAYPFPQPPALAGLLQTSVGRCRTGRLPSERKASAGHRRCKEAANPNGHQVPGVVLRSTNRVAKASTVPSPLRAKATRACSH